MTHFTLSLATGAVAGALVVIPMIFQRCSARSCIASFLIYLFAAVMVFYGDLPYLPWWADGMGITVMLTLPTLFAATGKGQRRIEMPFVQSTASRSTNPSLSMAAIWASPRA